VDERGEKIKKLERSDAAVRKWVVKLFHETDELRGENGQSRSIDTTSIAGVRSHDSARESIAASTTSPRTGVGDSPIDSR